MKAVAPGSPAHTSAKRLNVFERWLSLRVALCTVAGIALGKDHVLGLLDKGRGMQPHW